MTENVQNNSVNWEDTIEWENKEEHKAVDSFVNYYNFLLNHPEFKDKFIIKGKYLYYKGSKWKNKEDKKYVKNQCIANMGIKNINSIEIALREIERVIPYEESDNDADNIIISQSFLNEYNTVNDNIDDEELIKSIYNDLNSKPSTKSKKEKEWSDYRDWKENKATKNYSSKGEVKGYDDSYDSIREWMKHYPPLKNGIVYNEFTDKILINGREKGKTNTHACMCALNHHLLQKYSNYLGFSRALDSLAYENKFNPIQDYLYSLKYDDSKNWIRYIITDVLKCPDEEFWDLYEFELKTWLCAFIKRNVKENYYKDVKFDNVLVFASEAGGTGKSSIVEQLFTFNGHAYAVNQPTQNLDFTNKDILQKMHNGACVNFDEINVSGGTGGFVTNSKTFIQNTRDTYRTPYEVNSEDHIRHFVFAASTNNNDILRDITAKENERRWWIIHVTEDGTNGINVIKMFTDKKLKLADKVWAQAMHEYRKNPDMPMWIVRGDEYDKKLTEIQAKYNASNQNDYIDIKNIINMEWGFYDKYNVDVNAIVEQYLYGNAEEWCEKHNKQIYELEHNEHHTMQPTERYIKYFGHIDKVNCQTFHEILKKIGLAVTPKRVKHSLELTKKWIAKVAVIDKTSNRAYVRCAPYNDLREFNANNINKHNYDETEEDIFNAADYSTEGLEI